jgi:hypothetical protein
MFTLIENGEVYGPESLGSAFVLEKSNRVVNLVGEAA